MTSSIVADLTPDPPNYLTEEQFCAAYGIGRRTAQRWRLTGEGPAFCRLGPKRIRYRVADCEAWAAARTFVHRAAELASSQRCAA